MARVRPGDHSGRSRRARGGMRHVSRRDLAMGTTGGRERRARPYMRPATARAATRTAARTIRRASTLMAGKTVVVMRIRERTRRTETTTVATAFTQGRFTQGPRTAASLQRRTRNTVALGKRTPARAWTLVVM